MVGPIIVLPPPSAESLRGRSPREPAHKRPAKVYYRRYCPKTGSRHEFCWYKDKLEDVEEQVTMKGNTYWFIGYEQDDGFVPYTNKKE